MVAVHLAYPAAMFTDRGKTELALPTTIADAVTDAVIKVTAGWTKHKRRRSVTARRESGAR